jgi:hypothetical protein
MVVISGGVDVQYMHKRDRTVNTGNVPDGFPRISHILPIISQILPVISHILPILPVFSFHHPAFQFIHIS